MILDPLGKNKIGPPLGKNKIGPLWVIILFIYAIIYK